MKDSNTIRLLQDPPLAGPLNMARDEALMTRVGTGESPPTLRLYQWDPPAISLGYFQCYADYQALPSPAGDLAVVRRQTGGGAILHDLEVTYSLTLPVDHPLLANGPNHLYEVMHDATIACLGRLGLTASLCGSTDDSGPRRGPFFCFERRHAYDVLVDRDKIAGSAQRRTHRAILQHGSIILGNRYGQQATADVAGGIPRADPLHRPGHEPRGRSSDSDPSPPAGGGTKSEACERMVRGVRSTIAEDLASLCESRIEPGDWSDVELAAAYALVPKYRGNVWTRRR